jgi:hypothetical protein
VGYDFGHIDKKMNEQTKLIFTTEKIFLDKLTKDLKKKELD